nr:hypothetical protein [Cellulosimicrobium sp. CUA-896]
MLNVKNRSFSVTARVEVTSTPVEGVLIAQGGRFGGWSVYVHGGRLTFLYNVLGIQHYAVVADEQVPTGSLELRAELAYDGGGLGKGGDVTLYHDGTKVGSGRVDATQPLIFSADETTDVGYESGTCVSPEYTTRTSRFTGRLRWVRLDVGTDTHDHHLDPEHRMHVALAQQ